MIIFKDISIAFSLSLFYFRAALVLLMMRVGLSRTIMLKAQALSLSIFLLEYCMISNAIFCIYMLLPLTIARRWS